jgi:hypothetical protein
MITALSESILKYHGKMICAAFKIGIMHLFHITAALCDTLYLKAVKPVCNQRVSQRICKDVISDRYLAG